MKPAILVMGLPASGKSTITKDFAAQGYTILNRDSEGGTIANLVPRFAALLAAGTPVVLDNLNLTVEDRKPFVDVARQAGVPIECHWMTTSMEDAQVNALHRMFDRYHGVFMTADEIKGHAEAKKDPNVFPPVALFAARKKLEGDKKANIPSGKPTEAEGFSRVVKVPFIRRPYPGKNKALILDYDGTLRRDAKEVGGEYHYPTCIEQVQALPNRGKVLQDYSRRGYTLLGASTQSGIAKGHLTGDMARQCFVETERQIEAQVDGGVYLLETLMCPHGSFPVSCYCRKPQAGIGVYFIRKYDLNPSDCIMVGDLGTDASFAQRCGFQFAEADLFFK
jgi:D-glycero-D-manno-heptose 1,7-bisphosphate phosphatase